MQRIIYLITIINDAMLLKKQSRWHLVQALIKRIIGNNSIALNKQEWFKITFQWMPRQILYIAIIDDYYSFIDGGLINLVPACNL